MPSSSRLVLLTSLTLVLGFSAGCDQGSHSTMDGSSGSGGTSAGTGGSGGQMLTGLIVDDFEDGDDRPLVTGGWYEYTDADNGGNSVLTFTGADAGVIAMNGVGYQSERSLEVSYTFDQGTYEYDPYVGFGVWLGDTAAPFDARAYTGVSFVYRGGAHRVRVETSDVSDYDFFGTDLPASVTWKPVTVTFPLLTQQGFGAPVAFDASHVTGISFQTTGKTGDSAELDVDTLMLTSDSGNRTPDMAVNPAQPPTETVIDPITIDNPLQAKAEQYLDRGYNVTNWLEQERFDGFTYDEDFVRKLSAAGFKSLRLPIDLDLYVSERSGSGDDLAISVDDELFTILDSFSEWTEKYGLSLTIDYHQYDQSLVVADPDSVTEAVLLWGKVAEHFRDNPREDLFYELLNEPELSAGGTPPTQAQWTGIAQRMIDAIRAEDTTHTIIFGDVQYYGIDALATRQPFADDNVIYSFHDYDPFIFTHQGASWAGMASTHDLPFPYTPERWSQYFSDLGFTPFMESWILDQARSYYRNGNRASLWNHIAVAKRWGIDHDVPVICNEFGAYDGSSRLEDRARYYSDVVDIFETLHIPWQHWFMIMDANGDVIPEYREAMRLDQ